MRIIIKLSILAALTLIALPVVAHHMAEGIVDEEVYAMIDELVSDTPHADMVLTDLGNGMTEIQIMAPPNDLEDIIAGGMLGYVGMLDGDVTMSIDFTSTKVLAVTIVQIEAPEDANKALPETESTTLSELKARYR